MSDFRIDKDGVVLQPCPRCGHERTPSYDAMRRHDELCLESYRRERDALLVPVIRRLAAQLARELFR